MNLIIYDGFCLNDMHKQWLEGVMDRSMLKGKASEELRQGYLGRYQEVFRSISRREVDILPWQRGKGQWDD